eukprot:GEMP01029790.1.p1 GENE.GEMP01029790.1~~GEMP01029790.1.p1  ORF type:complete len:231 (+),score=58.86 GEMP01029790.1:1-693(+)
MAPQQPRQLDGSVIMPQQPRQLDGSLNVVVTSNPRNLELDGSVMMPQEPRQLDGSVAAPQQPRKLDGSVAAPQQPRQLKQLGEATAPFALTDAPLGLQDHITRLTKRSLAPKGRHGPLTRASIASSVTAQPTPPTVINQYQFIYMNNLSPRNSVIDFKRHHCDPGHSHPHSWKHRHRHCFCRPDGAPVAWCHDGEDTCFDGSPRLRRAPSMPVPARSRTPSVTPVPARKR